MAEASKFQKKEDSPLADIKESEVSQVTEPKDEAKQTAATEPQTIVITPNEDETEVKVENAPKNLTIRFNTSKLRGDRMQRPIVSNF